MGCAQHTRRSTVKLVECNRPLFNEYHDKCVSANFDFEGIERCREEAEKKFCRILER